MTILLKRACLICGCDISNRRGDAQTCGAAHAKRLQRSSKRKTRIEGAWVYRLFSSVGDLLYIGSTVKPSDRLRAHRNTQIWWEQVARTHWTHYSTVPVARATEELAILIEQPTFNVVGR